jgi:hypothetical protein
MMVPGSEGVGVQPLRETTVVSLEQAELGFTTADIDALVDVGVA